MGVAVRELSHGGGDTRTSGEAGLRYVWSGTLMVSIASVLDC